MEKAIDWYRTPIERETLRSLTKRSNVRGLLQSGAFLLLYACTVGVTIYFFLHRMWIPMAILCYVHASFHSFVGMEAAVHELSHGTPFRTKWLNEVFYHIFSFLTWNNPIHFRISHMKHHQFTVHRGLDKEVVIDPIPFTMVDILSWFTFDYKKFKMFMKANFAHFVGKSDVDFFFWDPLLPEGDKMRKKMCNWARILIIGHLVLLGVFIYFHLWVLIFTVNFGYFFATFLSHGTGALQHMGLCENHPDWRVTCRTVRVNPLIGFLYWHMNYHIEHHMFAAVPFFNLKKLHRAMAFDTPAPARSYLAGLKGLRMIQKKQRENPDYCFTPDFPATATLPKFEVAK